MKKSKLINSEISAVIAKMGHTDTLTVCDCGLPIGETTQRIDLAVTRQFPRFFDVLDAVLDELGVENVIVAQELYNGNTDVIKEVESRFPGIKIKQVPHESFKKLANESMAIVRTGECTPYLNIILEASAF